MFTLIAWKYASFRHKNMMLGRMIELSVVVLFWGAITVLCMADDHEVMLLLYAFCVALFCMALCFFFKKADFLRNAMPD
ncbi:conserved hypothetical protein [Vibrio coralliirubri]|uniref:hypothetical protein n=1 Tax=Vibrio coralliirubri TaxID=1516159 RepID=UPI000633BDD7|nr:hypothetical protein [Vibrio coralliirubri]CDU05752.1 conserved hypothetical protein [Vibrio coralliirubri]